MKIGWPPSGYRKYSLGLAALVYATDLRLLDTLTGEQWIIVCSAVVGLTGLGSVGEHFASRPHNPNPADPVTNVTADDDATITTTVNE